MLPIQSSFPIVGFLESRIGGRDENQDSCGFSDTPIGALAVVCDGMGGMNGGSTASNIAVNTIIEYIASVDKEDNPESVIRRAVYTANENIIRAAEENPELNLQGMGTTLTLVLINKFCAYVTYAGDSRIYLIRSGRKAFRTFDDSVVFQLVKSGALTEEDARLSSNSNIITKALGTSPSLECEVTCLPYDKHDRFLLCTDGFWGALNEKELLRLVSWKQDLSVVMERAFSRIERAARARHQECHDNLTALMFDVNCSSKFRSKMERKFKIATVILSLLLIACGGAIWYLSSKVNWKSSESELVQNPANQEAVDSTFNNSSIPGKQ